MLLGLAALGCGPDDGPPHFSCVEDLDLGCSPLHDPPTFEAVFADTLSPTCASGSGTCHTSDGAKAGLVFEDADEAYDLLLGVDGGEARVLPGDPACSLIVERLFDMRPDLRMPPGPAPLPAAEQCTIVRWIAEGAAR